MVIASNYGLKYTKQINCGFLYKSCKKIIVYCKPVPNQNLYHH